MIGFDEAFAIVSEKLRPGCKFARYAVDGDTYVFDMRDIVPSSICAVGNGYPYYTASESGLGMYPSWSPETVEMRTRVKWVSLDE